MGAVQADMALYAQHANDGDEGYITMAWGAAEVMGPHSLSDLRKWWIDAGCRETGTRYPQEGANIKWWNTQTVGAVQADMALYAQHANNGIARYVVEAWGAEQADASMEECNAQVKSPDASVGTGSNAPGDRFKCCKLCGCSSVLKTMKVFSFVMSFLVGLKKFVDAFISKHHIENFTNWTMVICATSRDWAGSIVKDYAEYISVAAAAFIALAIYRFSSRHTG